MKILSPLSITLLIAATAFAQTAQNNLGEFNISNPGGKITLNISPKTFQGTLEGPAPTIKSRQKVRELEMTARKIWGTSARVGPMKDLLSEATLTGNVRIRITELATGTLDIVTAERVNYKAGAEKGTGHADLIGKTTWKRYDKARQPLLSFTGQDGVIEFQGDSQQISLKDLEGSVAAPANKEKGKS